MKGRIRILGHVGLALFVAVALMLAAVPAQQAQADATGVTDVYVDFPYAATPPNIVSDTGGNNEYLVHFKPTTPLSRGADWVTVTFPDGTATMGLGAFTLGAVTASEVKFSTNFGTAFSATWVDSTSNAEVNGYRVKVRIPIDVAAGADVWLSIKSANVDSPSNVSNNYKVYVQTTKDTTRVLSSDFSLDGTVIDGDNDDVEVTTPTAGVASQYIFTFQTATAQQSEVTVRFPVGTVLPPDGIAQDELLFKSSGDYIVSGTPPVVDVARRTVTAQSSVLFTSDADNYIKIIVAAGIINPTTIGTYEPMIKTNIDAQWRLMDTSVTTIVKGTATKLAFTTASDNATILNAFAGALVLQSQDVNGNINTDGTGFEARVSMATTGTGTFHPAASSTLWATYETLSSGTINAYYMPTTVGTHVLTATDVSVVPTLAPATITIYVAPAVVLTDSVDNEIGTYGPAADSWGSSIGGTYIQNAINAAATGDTVTLGDGIYELSAVINLNKLITLTAASSATPTLRPTSDEVDAINVTVSGTAANPVVINGLTFDRLSSTVEFDQGVYNNGYNFVTVSNNTFNYITPANVSDYQLGCVVGFIVDAQSNGAARNITSGTISNNAFNNCGDWGYNTWGEQAALINVFAKNPGSQSTAAQTITGVTVSGNTLTDNNAIGIIVKGNDGIAGMTATANVTNNISTGDVSPISIQGRTSAVNVTGNTISGGYWGGIWVESSDHDSLVIRNNTITGSGGAFPISLSTSAAIRIDGDSQSEDDPVTLQYNAIYDNDTTSSIYVAAVVTGITQAQYNWYGSASGPGTSVSGLAADVTTTPWLHKSLADVVAANASYPALTVSLSVGWNTLSTPAKLMSSVDALNELVPAGVTIAYKYDSVSGWVQITDDVLLPCDAFYVKMSSAQTVLFKVDGAATHVPTKDLAAGWNLMGLASLTAKTDAGATASVTAKFAQLVSPSMNTAEWVYISGADATNSLVVGEGYWIFMTSAATLGGFTLCPIAPDLD